MNAFTPLGSPGKLSTEQKPLRTKLMLASCNILASKLLCSTLKRFTRVVCTSRRRYCEARSHRGVTAYYSLLKAREHKNNLLK